MLDPPQELRGELAEAVASPRDSSPPKEDSEDDGEGKEVLTFDFTMDDDEEESPLASEEVGDEWRTRLAEDSRTLWAEWESAPAILAPPTSDDWRGAQPAPLPKPLQPTTPRPEAVHYARCGEALAASTFDSSTGCSSADRRRLISWFILSASSR